MEALIFYDENGKVWLIAHGETREPKEMKCMKAELPEDAQLTGVDLSDPDNPSPVFSYARNADENLVECIRAKVKSGENLRALIRALNLPDEEKWKLEKSVKEGL